MEGMKHFLYVAVGVPLVLLALSAMAGAPEKSGWDQISAARILENIKVLSSDEYEGRAPASKGETLATGYIEDQFKKVGLKPGNPDGTYFQNVPMVGIKADPARAVGVHGPCLGKRRDAELRRRFCGLDQAPAAG